MKHLNRAALAAMLAGLALPLHAEVLDTRPYVSGSYAYTFDDEDRASENGNGFYVAGGKALNKFWNVELGSFYNHYEAATNGAEWKDIGAKIDGQFFYSRNRSFAPYFGVGVGGQHIQIENTNLDDYGPMVDAGFGFLKYFDIGSKDVAFKADARYRWQFLESDVKEAIGVETLGEPVVSVGLLVPFGPRPVEATYVPPPPPPAPVPPPPAPEAPKPVPPPDSDGDGVLDANDRCPGTPRGEPVDAYGCSKSQLTKGDERQFDDVLFDFNKSTITKQGQMILDNAAAVVNSGEFARLKINVSGHADWVGSEGYNQALSERRANVVKSYLVKKGVAANRIRTFAYGETQPVADNNTDEGRALNRRTEVRTTAGE